MLTSTYIPQSIHQCTDTFIHLSLYTAYLSFVLIQDQTGLESPHQLCLTLQRLPQVLSLPLSCPPFLILFALPSLSAHLIPLWAQSWFQHFVHCPEQLKRSWTSVMWIRQAVRTPTWTLMLLHTHSTVWSRNSGSWQKVQTC